MIRILSSTKSFIIKCNRVWHIMKKPTRKEFERVTKVSAIGIVILGVVGFLISIFVKLFA